MGRQLPEYCEHYFCIDPGDESFGLTEQKCPFCAMTEYPEMAARIAQLQQENGALKEKLARLEGVVGKWARLNARYPQDAAAEGEFEQALHNATCELLAYSAEEVGGSE